MSDKIVYSTGAGDLREKKRTPAPRMAVKSDGIVRVRRESKGRGGKNVSVVYGLPLSGDRLSDMAAELKRGCGTGGTVKDNTIIIQGDKVDFILQFLQRKGYTVKRSGGN